MTLASVFHVRNHSQWLTILQAASLTNCFISRPFHSVHMSLFFSIDGFSWDMASLLEGKSRGLCLVQLCAKCRLVSAISSPYH